MPLFVGGTLAVAGGAPAEPAPGGATGAGSSASAERRSPPGLAELGERARRAADELGAWVRERGGEVGVAVVDPESQRVLVDLAAEQPLNPASNAKLLTAAVALARLGPHHRFTTGLYGSVRGDRLGDLVLRGTGDPSLTTDDLAGLCRSLAALGVRRVEGRILVDGSRFDAQTVPPAFDQQPNEWAAFRAPVSAVALDRNRVTAHVLPGVAGERARVWFEPPGLVTTVGSFETVAKGRGQDLRIDWRERGDGLQARLSGHVAEGLPLLRFSRRLDDPTLLPGRVLAQLLAREGIVVSGGVAVGGSDERQRLVEHRSAPLGQLLAELGKASDNFYAEMIFKTLGVGARGEPASFARAATAVTAWARSVGVAGAGFRVTNGSGLFDANRISAATLARTLVVARRDPAIASDFEAQLAIGGVDGTLASRFRAARGARSVRAKTGTLARVDALSGYVYVTGRSSPLAFSVLVNGVTDHGGARTRIDRVVASVL